MSNVLSFNIENFTIQPDDIDELNKIVTAHNEQPDVMDLVIENGGDMFPAFKEVHTGDSSLSGVIALPIELFNQDVYDFAYVMDNWLDLLSELKLYLKGSQWTVRIDDYEFEWDEKKKKFEVPG